MKQCKRCKENKPLHEFHVHHRMKDGHLNFCKDCTRKRISLYGKTERGKEVDKKRNQNPERKKKVCVYGRRSKLKYQKKRRAGAIFWNEFKKGTIPKLPCEKCSTKEWVEAHHPDYDKPLEVMWLCSLHHKEWHRKYSAKNPF